MTNIIKEVDKVSFETDCTDVGEPKYTIGYGVTGDKLNWSIKEVNDQGVSSEIKGTAEYVGECKNVRKQN